MTKHKEEVPLDTMSNIYQLMDTKVDRRLRGQVPLQGPSRAAHNPDVRGCELVFYEVRRSKEVLEDLKLVDFKELEDETF